MSASYLEPSENRGIPEIPRPFPKYPEATVRTVFETVVGAKEAPSEGERRLIERARRYCTPLRFFPGIAAVWVCNSLSMNAADADSDIDLFVEADPGRIWTARMLATAYFQLLGVRRHGEWVKGRFCLSFFAVRGADFRKIAIEDDVYLYEWKRRLVPIVSGTSVPDGGAFSQLEAGRGSKGAFGVRRAEFFGACARLRIGDLFESVFKRLFLSKTLAEYERLGRPWGIRVDDEFLKFHPEDRRVELREKVREGLEGR